MANLIINIKPELENVLWFLFPQYTYETALSKKSDFILRKDISSQKEKLFIESNFENYIIISRKIYEEVWTKDTLIEKAIEIRKKFFKERRRNFDFLRIEDDALFVDSLVKFIFSHPSKEQQEESSITELFDNFGSVNFANVYVKELVRTPHQVLFSSMLTFVIKIKTSDSTYYKRKRLVFKDKIEKNLVNAALAHERAVLKGALNDLNFILNLY